MQAIEFETRIEGRSIPLPGNAEFPTGQAVRVIVMYDGAPSSPTGRSEGAIARLSRNPLLVPGFKPFSRDGSRLPSHGQPTALASSTELLGQLNRRIGP